MRVTCRPGRGQVLCCMLRAASAFRRVADKVQGPKDPVAQEQRPHEEERQELLSGRTREQAISQPATV
jgi:hypothetical protein